VKTEDGLSALDYVDSLKTTSPHYWPTSVGSGARHADGRPPGGMSNSEIGSTFPGQSGNPFDPTSSAWNLTKQSEIYKADSQLAEKMKAAVGQK